MRTSISQSFGYVGIRDGNEKERKNILSACCLDANPVRSKSMAFGAFSYTGLSRNTLILKMAENSGNQVFNNLVFDDEDASLVLPYVLRQGASATCPPLTVTIFGEVLHYTNNFVYINRTIQSNENVL